MLGRSWFVSAQPGVALCAIQYQRELYALCHPITQPSPQRLGDQLANRPSCFNRGPHPMTGGWEKWIWLVFSEPQSRGGARRQLPRSQDQAPASSPAPT